MTVHDESFSHAVRKDRIRVVVFEQPGAGLLVAEARDGTQTVFATLGVFAATDAALARAARRGAELLRQGYERVPTGP
jgi:hypothetical protein